MTTESGGTLLLESNDIIPSRTPMVFEDEQRLQGYEQRLTNMKGEILAEVERVVNNIRENKTAAVPLKAELLRRIEIFRNAASQAFDDSVKEANEKQISVLEEKISQIDTALKNDEAAEQVEKVQQAQQEKQQQLVEQLLTLTPDEVATRILALMENQRGPKLTKERFQKFAEKRRLKKDQNESVAPEQLEQVESATSAPLAFEGGEVSTQPEVVAEPKSLEAVFAESLGMKEDALLASLDWLAAGETLNDVDMVSLLALVQTASFTHRSVIVMPAYKPDMITARPGMMDKGIALFEGVISNDLTEDFKNWLQRHEARFKAAGLFEIESVEKSQPATAESETNQQPQAEPEAKSLETIFTESLGISREEAIRQAEKLAAGEQLDNEALIPLLIIAELIASLPWNYKIGTNYQDHPLMTHPRVKDGLSAFQKMIVGRPVEDDFIDFSIDVNEPLVKAGLLEKKESSTAGEVLPITPEDNLAEVANAQPVSEAAQKDLYSEILGVSLADLYSFFSIVEKDGPTALSSDQLKPVIIFGLAMAELLPTHKLGPKFEYHNFARDVDNKKIASELADRMFGPEKENSRMIASTLESLRKGNSFLNTTGLLVEKNPAASTSAPRVEVVPPSDDTIHAEIVDDEGPGFRSASTSQRGQVVDGDFVGVGLADEGKGQAEEKSTGLKFEYSADRFKQVLKNVEEALANLIVKKQMLTADQWIDLFALAQAITETTPLYRVGAAYENHKYRSESYNVTRLKARGIREALSQKGVKSTLSPEDVDAFNLWFGKQLPYFQLAGVLVPQTEINTKTQSKSNEETSSPQPAQTTAPEASANSPATPAETMTEVGTEETKQKRQEVYKKLNDIYQNIQSAGLPDNKPDSYDNDLTHAERFFTNLNTAEDESAVSRSGRTIVTRAEKGLLISLLIAEKNNELAPALRSVLERIRTTTT
jgi:hypothetical protein